MNALSTFVFALAASSLAVACSATTMPRDDGGSGDTSVLPDGACTPTRTPAVHRASAAMCPTTRGETSCMAGFGPPGECTASAQCTSGTNGRCVGNPHDGCHCNYDLCQQDTDCTLGGPCSCRDNSRGASGANVCLAGNCRVDGDCACGFCSPTLGSCGDYSGTVGYYCHTPQDECTDDADCATGDAGFLGQRPYCAYQSTTGRWACSNQACAG